MRVNGLCISMKVNVSSFFFLFVLTSKQLCMVMFVDHCTGALAGGARGQTLIFTLLSRPCAGCGLRHLEGVSPGGGIFF